MALQRSGQLVNVHANGPRSILAQHPTRPTSTTFPPPTTRWRPIILCLMCTFNKAFFLVIYPVFRPDSSLMVCSFRLIFTRLFAKPPRGYFWLSFWLSDHLWHSGALYDCHILAWRFWHGRTLICYFFFSTPHTRLRMFFYMTLRNLLHYEPRFSLADELGRGVGGGGKRAPQPAWLAFGSSAVFGTFWV